VLPAGTLLCFGCTNLLAHPREGKNHKMFSEKHKFLEDSGMTIEEVFKFTFQENFIPLMQTLAKDVGREKFIEMLKKASSVNTAQMIKDMTKDLPKKDFPAFVKFMKDFVEIPLFQKTLTYEIVEETDKVFEVKFSECLYAKTYNEANASDIGYAVHCYPSPAMVSAFNPKIKAESPKNLLRGDSVCIERYVWEG